MHIDRVFKGKLDTEVELIDDGMCNGPDFRIGRQYLMYTLRAKTGRLLARGCTRSRALEEAGEDLRFLQESAAGKAATLVSGVVRFRPNEPDDRPPWSKWCHRRQSPSARRIRS